jgi:hypothetical protein
MAETYDLMSDTDETFSMAEFERIIREYVCGVCHSELHAMFANARERVLIVCPEHGNVTHCGRVTRNTVSIEMERAHRRFREACQNLPDLWGQFTPAKKSEDQLLKELGF